MKPFFFALIVLTFGTYGSALTAENGEVVFDRAMEAYRRLFAGDNEVSLAELHSMNSRVIERLVSGDRDLVAAVTKLARQESILEHVGRSDSGTETNHAEEMILHYYSASEEFETFAEHALEKKGLYPGAQRVLVDLLVLGRLKRGQFAGLDGLLGRIVDNKKIGWAARIHAAQVIGYGTGGLVVADLSPVSPSLNERELLREWSSPELGASYLGTLLADATALSSWLTEEKESRVGFSAALLKSWILFALSVHQQSKLEDLQKFITANRSHLAKPMLEKVQAYENGSITAFSTSDIHEVEKSCIRIYAEPYRYEMATVKRIASGISLAREKPESVKPLIEALLERPTPFFARDTLLAKLLSVLLIETSPQVYLARLSTIGNKEVLAYFAEVRLGTGASRNPNQPLFGLSVVVNQMVNASLPEKLRTYSILVDKDRCKRLLVESGVVADEDTLRSANVLAGTLVPSILDSEEFSSFSSLYGRNWFWSSLDMVAFSRGVGGVNSAPMVKARESFQQKVDAAKFIGHLLQSYRLPTHDE